MSTNNYFHFTSLFHLPKIMAEGFINRGDVPTSRTGGFKAPWLTTDPDPRHHRWGTGCNVDKTAVCLDILIPETACHAAISWLSLRGCKAGQNVDPAWWDILNHTGGGSAPSWFIYYPAFAYGQDHEARYGIPAGIPIRWIQRILVRTLYGGAAGKSYIAIDPEALRYETPRTLADRASVPNGRSVSFETGKDITDTRAGDRHEGGRA